MDVQKSTMTYISGDDWVALYYEGELLVEGHSLHPFTIMRLMMQHSPFHIAQLDADPDWLEEQGSFPSKLEDVCLSI